MQDLFLNGRYIRDRSLQHALSEAYRGLLMTGRYPACFLTLEIPFELVDVNVHPAKLEVRFQNGGQIYSQLLSTVRDRFLSTDLTAHAQLSKKTVEPFRPFPQSDSGGTTVRPGVSGQHNQETISFTNAAPAFDWTQAPRQPQLAGNEYASSANAMDSSVGHGGFSGLTQSDQEQANPNQAAMGVAPSQTPTALQVHNTYLVSETAEGMIVIDQHALHERVIYEQIRGKVVDGKLESQRLLVPEPVSLPPAEAAAVLEQTELLEQLGISISPFGGGTVLVSAYPAMLNNQNPAEMLRSVADQIVEGGKTLDQRDLVDELLHMISCKAAVKAGDRLSPEEITALLEHRELCQDAHHCPHGRPTSLVFSRDELDRRFKRI
ncbi:MAG: DNA mismatch repair endonuclease MutL, partial [Pseudomonadota bacterium]